MQKYDNSLSPTHQKLLEAFLAGDAEAYRVLKHDLSNRVLDKQLVVEYLFNRKNFIKGLHKIPVDFLKELLLWQQEKQITLNSKNLEIVFTLLTDSEIEILYTIPADNSAILSLEDLAYIYNYSGNQYYAKKCFSKAYYDFSLAIANDPDNACYITNRGIVLYAMKQYELAITELLKALKLDPKNAACYKYLGCAYVESADYAKAVINFTTAITLEPYNPENYENRAIAYRWQNNHAAALADYEVALAYYDRLLGMTNDPDIQRHILENMIKVQTQIQKYITAAIATGYNQAAFPSAQATNPHRLLAARAPEAPITPPTERLEDFLGTTPAAQTISPPATPVLPQTANAARSQRSTTLVVPEETERGAQCRLI